MVYDSTKSTKLKGFNTNTKAFSKANDNFCKSTEKLPASSKIYDNNEITNPGQMLSSFLMIHIRVPSMRHWDI